MNMIDQIFLNKDMKDVIVEPTQSRKINFSRLNATSVIIPIIFFEILVCVLGTQFYASIGYEIYSAVILAVTIEVFYMYFSSKKDFKSSIIRMLLLSISITTLTYSAYIKDENVVNSSQLIRSDLKDSKIRLLEVGEELKRLGLEEVNIEKDMQLFREYKKATKGNLILAPRRSELNIRRKNLLKERSHLKKAIANIGNKILNHGFFSNLSLLTIKTIVSILAFSILQISICIALPDVLSELRLEK